MNSYPSPQYRQEDQNQGGILDTLGKIALTAGAGVGLLYGLNPKNRQALKKQIENIAYDQKVVENIQKVRAASKTSPETTTTAFRSERPRGTQVVDLNQISDPSSGEMPIRPVQVSEVPNVQPQRLALPGQQERLALPAVIKEDPYVPVSSSEPPSWQSAGNMVGDYGQLYGARRNKGTIRAIEQARRQAAADTYVNAIRSNPDSYQLSIPGVNPELIALRSKEGLPSPGELTGIAESRPLSAAPEQGSFALTYNQARGAVAPTNPVVSQAVEAIDTGADQAAMRVSRTVQRDPSESLTEFELVQDAYEQRGASPVQAADAAVTATEGNVAFTQTDAPVQGPISAQETADAALAEMKARRAEVVARGLQPGTTRYERALAQSFRTSANVKPQMTGESMAKTALPAGPIRQTVQSVGAVDFETLPERTVPNIGPEAVVTKTARGTAIRGASPVLEQAPPISRQRPIFGTADTNVPGAPDEYMPDRPARETALSQIETQPQERIDPYAVKQQEGGGSAGIGVYGIEPSYVPGAQSKSTGLMSAASERKPTDVRQSALDKVRNPYSNLSDQELGQISMIGTASEAYNASKQLTKRRSIDVSREIQQLQKSGRPDAQQLVQQYLQDLKQG